MDSGTRLDKDYAFSRIEALALPHRFIVPFYWIVQNAESEAYLQTVDYLESDRLFHFYLGLNAWMTGRFDRFISYTSYLYDVVAPPEKLPFHGIPGPPTSSEEDLKTFTCYVLSDDIAMTSEEVVQSEAFLSCLQD